jgi:SAM-dependent methyltransferase
MHPTALHNARLFFDTYALGCQGGTVLDIGAQDLNGSLRSVCLPELRYVGVDFVAGNGVDIVLDDPYRLPFESESVDIVVSSSCFEHSELFWVLFLEIMRVLKAPGLFYLNVPSNGPFHRHPVDCWRFYPDSGDALVISTAYYR